MSYSFTVRAPTKADALARVTTELIDVVARQPIHTADCEQAKAAAEAFLDILPEANDKQDFYLSVSGSVGWRGSPGTPEYALTSAGVSVSASFANK